MSINEILDYFTQFMVVMACLKILNISIWVCIPIGIVYITMIVINSFDEYED